MKKIYKGDVYNSYNEIMNNYFRTISEINTVSIVEKMNSVIEAIKPISLKTVENYSLQTFNTIADTISNSISNMAKLNMDIMNENINILIKNSDWNTILSNYHNIFEDIDIESIHINSDGTVQYENETVEIQEDNINEAVDILKNIENNTGDIKKKLVSKKSILIIAIVFIIQGIAGGFLNKCGETIYELIPSAYNTFLEDNNLENEENSKRIFFDKFRIINANELNVREEPNSKSMLIGKLYLNQCVEVIEKTSHWTKVQYVNKQKGISISGWVYSRYLLYFDEESSELIPE